MNHKNGYKIAQKMKWFCVQRLIYIHSCYDIIKKQTFLLRVYSLYMFFIKFTHKNKPKSKTSIT